MNFCNRKVGFTGYSAWLIYRDENEMYRLADGISENEISEMILLEEPLGINYFLKIVKHG